MVGCPYCSRPAVLTTGAVIYPHRPDLARKKFWHCSPCDAYVGCHARGSYSIQNGVKVTHTGDEPFGRLANARLRRLKTHAHARFDPLWRSGYIGRREAYALAAQELGIPVDDCHIGMFDEELCMRLLNAIPRLQHLVLTAADSRAQHFNHRNTEGTQ
jgi:hypothetical protein